MFVSLCKFFRLRFVFTLFKLSQVVYDLRDFNIHGFNFSFGSILPINVPVVYMARDIMILMWAIFIYDAIGRGGP